MRRCARTRVCGQRRIAPLMRYAGAGSRLSCLPRARRERAALRAHPSLWAASHCSAHALRGSGHSAELLWRAPGAKRAALRAHLSLWAASHCSARALRGSGQSAELLGARPARACGAARAAEFVGSVALLRSCATRERQSAELSAARPARACGAARAAEFVGSVALLRSCATRERAIG